MFSSRSSIIIIIITTTIITTATIAADTAMMRMGPAWSSCRGTGITTIITIIIITAIGIGTDC